MHDVAWNGDIHGPNRGLLGVVAEPTRPAPSIFEKVTPAKDTRAMRALMADGQARTFAEIATALGWSLGKAEWLVRKAYSRGWLRHVGQGRYQTGRTHTSALPFTSEELAS